MTLSYTRRWQLLLCLLFYVTIVIDGAAIPSILGKSIGGSRMRGNDGEESSSTKQRLESDITAFPTQKKDVFNSLLAKIRNPRVAETVVDEEEDDFSQLPTQQHNMPLPCLILAAASKSFGPNPNGGSILNAVLRNPKWLFVGGALYQTQKALRSEAVRRAARFWVKIGPVVAPGWF